MTDPSILDFAVVGAGPCGIAAAQALAARGIEHFVILDEGDDFGGIWDHRRRDSPVYASLRTVTSAATMTLGGVAFPAPGAEFPSAVQVLDFLRSSAATFGIAHRLRTRTRVTRLHRDGAAGWRIATSSGAVIHARRVVLATGDCWKPRHLPDFPGPVAQVRDVDPDRFDVTLPAVVVGGGTSAATIATDLAVRGTDVIWSLPDSGRWLAPASLDGEATDLPIPRPGDDYFQEPFAAFQSRVGRELSGFARNHLPRWRTPTSHAPFDHAMVLTHDLPEVVRQGGLRLSSVSELLPRTGQVFIAATGYLPDSLWAGDTGADGVRCVEAEGTLGRVTLPNSDLGGFWLMSRLADHVVDVMLRGDRTCRSPLSWTIPPRHMAGGPRGGFVHGSSLVRHVIEA